PSFGPLKHLDPHRPDPLTLTPALRSGFSRVRDAVDRGHHRTRTRVVVRTLVERDHCGVQF
ncbi:hypothetical protein, partial [Methylobacterium sp. Leaf87]|uniref:hypothetical protein n=1 Tax=Methylobacterium sp. Leaf87 TaxID=1736243 RepID=UPI001AEBC8A7